MNEDEHKKHDDDAEKKIIEDVKKYGFHIALLPEDEYLPGFAYTIGLFETYNHPEIIIFGLNQEVSGHILNHVGDEIKKGNNFKPNENYSGIIDNYPVQFLEVKKEHYPDYLGYCGWYYKKTFNFPSLQIIWPDKNNLFPWENGFFEKWKFRQPLLDRNIDFKFYEEKNLAVYTTKDVFEGKPILYAFHEEDGDWQFHSQENPNIENVMIVSLNNLVEKDLTLNEIHFLNYGESASRKDINSEWEIFNIIDKK